MKIKHLLIAFVAIFTFMGCSDDDEPTPTSPIVGTWKYSVSGGIVEGTNLTEEVRLEVIRRRDPAPGYRGAFQTTFRTDGTGEIEVLEENSKVLFRYTLNGNLLKLVELNSNEEQSGIVEINGNKLRTINTNPSDLEKYKELFPESGLTRVDTYQEFVKQ